MVFIELSLSELQAQQTIAFFISTLLAFEEGQMLLNIVKIVIILYRYCKILVTGQWEFNHFL